MSLITIINDSPLAADQKTMWISRIETEGATPEVIAGVREALQEYIDGGFQKLGVAMDPNDPGLVAASNKMNSELTAAQSDFNDSVADIEAEAKAVQSAVTKDAEKVQANMIKAQI